MDNVIQQSSAKLPTVSLGFDDNLAERNRDKERGMKKKLGNEYIGMR